QATLAAALNGGLGLEAALTAALAATLRRRHRATALLPLATLWRLRRRLRPATLAATLAATLRRRHRATALLPLAGRRRGVAALTALVLPRRRLAGRLRQVLELAIDLEELLQHGGVREDHRVLVFVEVDRERLPVPVRLQQQHPQPVQVTLDQKDVVAPRLALHLGPGLQLQTLLDGRLVDRLLRPHDRVHPAFLALHVPWDARHAAERRAQLLLEPAGAEAALVLH